MKKNKVKLTQLNINSFVLNSGKSAAGTVKGGASGFPICSGSGGGGTTPNTTFTAALGCGSHPFCSGPSDVCDQP